MDKLLSMAPYDPVQGYQIPRVKVSSRNQIAIPSEIRRKLGIKPGDRLIMDVHEHHILVARDPLEHPEDFIGPHDAWAGVDIDEYIRAERDAWTD